MAIALGGSTTSTALNSLSDSFALSTAGSNRLLVVIVHTDRVSGDVSHTSVTYNGVALTRAVYRFSSSTVTGVSLWYLVAPATGSNTVAVNVGTTGSNPHIYTYAAYFTDVDQSTPIPTTGTANSTATSVSTSITAAYSNSWLLSGVGIPLNEAITPSDTSMYATNNGTGVFAFAGSYEVGTSAGAYSLGGTWTSNVEFAQVLAELKQAPQTLTSTISESITLSEAITNPAVFPSTITETVTASEALQQTATEIQADIVTLAETIVATKVPLWATRSKSSTSWTNQSKT